MMKKLLLVVLFLVPAVVVLCAKFPALGRHFLADVNPDKQYYVGDAYALCLVDAYKERIRLFPPKDVHALNEADVIVLGDSFFNYGQDSPRFAELLGSRLGLAVSNIADENARDIPLAYLERHLTGPKRPRVLVLESIDIAALQRAQRYLSGGARDTGWFNFARTLKRKLFVNTDIEYFFIHNKVLFPVTRTISNLQYRLLGEVNNANIIYHSRDPRMIFLKDSVDFNMRSKTRDERDALVRSVTALRDALKARLNIDLVYMIIPSNFALYGDLARPGWAYDGFITDVTGMLSKRGVSVVDAYAVLNTARRTDQSVLLFYSGDGHWTPRAKDSIVSATAQMVRGLQGRRHPPGDPAAQRADRRSE